MDESMTPTPQATTEPAATVSTPPSAPEPFASPPPAPSRPPPAARVAGSLVLTNVKSWLGTKGFILVLVAALLPLLLAAAWAYTHSADVAATEVSWTPEIPEVTRTVVIPGGPPQTVPGTVVNFTATIKNAGGSSVGAFNATISVGVTRELPNGTKVFEALERNQTRIPGLSAGESVNITMRWTPELRQQIDFNTRSLVTRQDDSGTLEVLVDADVDEEIGELDEFNNRHQKGILIQIGATGRDFFELPPSMFAGNSSAPTVVDLAVDELRWQPSELHPDTNATFSIRVRNVGATSADGAVVNLTFMGEAGPLVNRTETLAAFGPGESRELNLTVRIPAAADPENPKEIYGFHAMAVVPDGTRDDNTTNNQASQIVIVDRELTFPEPPPRATIRGFFIQIMEQLQLPIIIPLIGLFYAAGVLADEREKGTLPYLLTRPVPRALIPVARFSVSFVVAAAALTAGTIGSFLLIFGLNQGDWSYFMAPLFISLLALFAYGTFFTLLGIWVDRPYLIGLAFVVGWEAVAPVFVPWVKNLTLTHHLLRIVNEWSPAEELPWPPESKDALTALYVILAVSVAFLVAAVVSMKRREFDV